MNKYSQAEAEYLTCSMYGSYWEPCEVLDKSTLNNIYLVKFYDHLAEETVTLWASEDMVRFPKFSELCV